MRKFLIRAVSAILAIVILAGFSATALADDSPSPLKVVGKRIIESNGQSQQYVVGKKKTEAERDGPKKGDDKIKSREPAKDIPKETLPGRTDGKATTRDSERNGEPDRSEKEQNPPKEEPRAILAPEGNLDDRNIPANWNTDPEIRAQLVSEIVELERRIMAGETDRKIAYLTFDDGPFARTRDYLSVLEQYNAKGTFFVVGKPSMADYYTLIQNKGHSIGNHTYSHDIFGGLYASPMSFINDVLKQEKFLNSLGVKTQIVRFPGGSATAGKNMQGCASQLYQNNFGWINWDSLTGDATKGSVSAEGAYNNVMKYMSGKKIGTVLMHDSYACSLEALPRIIESLRADGYMLLPLVYESRAVKKQ